MRHRTGSARGGGPCTSLQQPAPDQRVRPMPDTVIQTAVARVLLETIGTLVPIRGTLGRDGMTSVLWGFANRSLCKLLFSHRAMLSDDDFAACPRPRRPCDGTAFDLDAARAASSSLRSNARRAMLSRLNMTGILPVSEARVEVARRVSHILEWSLRREACRAAIAVDHAGLSENSVWLEARK